jgi:hypothetical protein
MDSFSLAKSFSFQASTNSGAANHATNDELLALTNACHFGTIYELFVRELVSGFCQARVCICMQQLRQLR